jgi:hypothetical protein
MMADFTDAKFCKTILDIAHAYVPFTFWTQNLDPRSEPDAAWKMVLLVTGATEFDIRDILQMPSPAGTTSTTREILVALQATETQVLGGESACQWTVPPGDVPVHKIARLASPIPTFTPTRQSLEAPYAQRQRSDSAPLGYCIASWRISGRIWAV